MKNILLILAILMVGCKSKQEREKEATEQAMQQIRKLAAPYIAADYQKIDDEMGIVHNTGMSDEERGEALDEFINNFRDVNPYVQKLNISSTNMDAVVQVTKDFDKHFWLKTCADQLAKEMKKDITEADIEAGN